MNKIRIVADDKIPFLRESPLAELTDLRLLPGGAITRNDLMNADALITRTRTACNAELLNGTAVRLIATATIGFDHIDTEYCKQAGIEWANAPGCNSASVAQYIQSSLLIWKSLRNKKPDELTIGIIGVGNVGSKVAKVAQDFGMRVLLNDLPREEKEGKKGERKEKRKGKTEGIRREKKNTTRRTDPDRSLPEMWKRSGTGRRTSASSAGGRQL